MPDATRVFPGRCHVSYDDGDLSESRGDATVVCRPDGTVLVHGAEGYQPVAWLTWADRVEIDNDVVHA